MQVNSYEELCKNSKMLTVFLSRGRGFAGFKEVIISKTFHDILNLKPNEHQHIWF